MTPEDLRSSIDDSWPVEVRFLIENAASSWEEDIKIEEQVQHRMTVCIFAIADELNSGLFKRIRAKDWKAMRETARRVCFNNIEGFRYFSAENKNNGPQEEIHPETDVPSLSRTKA